MAPCILKRVQFRRSARRSENSEGNVLLFRLLLSGPHSGDLASVSGFVKYIYIYISIWNSCVHSVKVWFTYLGTNLQSVDQTQYLNDKRSKHIGMGLHLYDYQSLQNCGFTLFHNCDKCGGGVLLVVPATRCSMAPCYRQTTVNGDLIVSARIMDHVAIWLQKGQGAPSVMIGALFVCVATSSIMAFTLSANNCVPMRPLAKIIGASF
jgi:hypothetical protein